MDAVSRRRKASGASVAEGLPTRAGPPPRTYRGLPHTQLDQQPDALIRAQLGRRFGPFADAEEHPSAVSVPGARALCVRPGLATGPPEAFLVGREFAHLHPLPDSSLHLALPLPLATQVVDLRWGELHPLAESGEIPDTTLMIYAPRNEDELDIVLRLVLDSYRFATRSDGAPANPWSSRRPVPRGPSA
jgi:Family of unknown function (DUF5519)